MAPMRKFEGECLQWAQHMHSCEKAMGFLTKVICHLSLEFVPVDIHNMRGMVNIIMLIFISFRSLVTSQ